MNEKMSAQDLNGGGEVPIDVCEKRNMVGNLSQEFIYYIM